MERNRVILNIVLPTPLRKVFDYAYHPTDDTIAPTPGMRVKISFGRRQCIGIIVGVSNHTKVPINKLKSIIQILDQKPILTPYLMRLGEFASQYYHHSLGDVYFSFLPKLLREGSNLLGEQTQTYYTLTKAALDLTQDDFKRAKRQYQLWQTLHEAYPNGLSKSAIKQFGFATAIIDGLIKKDYIIETQQQCETQTQSSMTLADPMIITLNQEQKTAVNTITNKLNQFAPFLLQGITGSGKTEVYMQVMSRVLVNQKQVLLLVPEIGLTPQTVSRIQQRFPVHISVLHSGLTDKERQLAWEVANLRKAKIVIGTRSALFTPMPNLGLIIIDEEHDLSFKQQDSLRYSARDLAVIRSKLMKIPIILGSATPSLESIDNVKKNRYNVLYLRERAGSAIPPEYQLIDLRSQPLNTGLSIELQQAIHTELKQNNQVLVFLNRRGFSPVLICHDCGWSSVCRHCDAKMTLHAKISKLQCHHCGVMLQKPEICPDCHFDQLIPIGIGTERLDEALQTLFPDFPILRIDSDTTRKKGSLQDYVQFIQQGNPCILLGTQMLAKGHHFPNVTLVAMLEADSGLYSADFRATERLAQLILQVGGRAGRAQKKGRVLIQTHMPKHPLLQTLLNEGYDAFANQLLLERQKSILPPSGNMALLRAQAPKQQTVKQFLMQLRQVMQASLSDQVHILGPIPAAMAKRANAYRMQLLWQSTNRKHLHQQLEKLIMHLEQQRLPSQLRWHLDVDPQEIL